MSQTPVLVATVSTDRDRVVELVGDCGGLVSEPVSDVGGRLVLETEFRSHRSARSAVDRLRARGHMAVVGPASRPGWFGDGGCVCQPWGVFDRAAASLVVEIDPGRGFGSGTHPSTLLALDEIWTRVAAGSVVLDLGCGTGVLGIVAARLGASRVDAIDIDEDAIRSTTFNAALNGVSGRVRPVVGPVPAGAHFDLVVANIHAPALIDLASRLRAALKPTGQLVLSGLSRGQVSMVGAAMRPLRIVTERTRDDWVVMVLEPGRSRATDQASIELRSSTDGAK